MDYIEIDFSVEPREPGSEILIVSLSEVGFESFVDTDNGFKAYIPEDKYSKAELMNSISPYSSTFRVHFNEKKIVQQNWNEEWEKNFTPIEIDGECYIRAPFHPASGKHRHEIIIEPKMSFGTGHHDTTQLMIKQMLQMDFKGKKVLDMGCGTGALAILASKMGAEEIWAVDIDEWSYENTIENINTNVIKNVVVKKGDAEVISKKLFFTILANINKNVLLTDMPQYVESLYDNGELVMSGFFETDSQELTKKAAELGLKLVDEKTSNGWALLHFKKTEH